MSGKAPEAFRTISEASELLDTPPHVLRFWETKFAQLKPVKRAGGRRYYRPQDIALLAGIKQLLHEDGLTIRGVQKILREKGVRHVAALVPVVVGESADQPGEDVAAPAHARTSAPAAAAVADAPPTRTEPPAPSEPPESPDADAGTDAARRAPIHVVPGATQPAPAQTPAATPTPEPESPAPAAARASAGDTPAASGDGPAPATDRSAPVAPAFRPGREATVQPSPVSTPPPEAAPAPDAPHTDPPGAFAARLSDGPPLPRVASLLRGIDPERLAGRQPEIHRLQERISRHLDRLAEASGAGRR